MKILTIDINGTCNLACEFCYQELDGSRLTAEEVFRIIDKKSDFGIVEIGGGEPSLHPELTDIVNGIVQRNRKVHLSTNGIIIPNRFLDLEADKSKVTVQVSMPAGEREAYERITGKDFFDAVIKNAEILSKNYTTVLSTAIYQKNFSQAIPILQIGYSLGIPTRVNLVLPVGKGKNVDLLSPEQIDRLKGILLLERINYRDMVDSPLIHEINCPALTHAYGFQSKEACPLSNGQKEYYDSKGQARDCEFYHRGKGE